MFSNTPNYCDFNNNNTDGVDSKFHQIKVLTQFTIILLYLFLYLSLCRYFLPDSWDFNNLLQRASIIGACKSAEGDDNGIFFLSCVAEGKGSRDGKITGVTSLVAFNVSVDPSSFSLPNTAATADENDDDDDDAAACDGASAVNDIMGLSTNTDVEASVVVDVELDVDINCKSILFEVTEGCFSISSNCTL